MSKERKRSLEKFWKEEKLEGWNLRQQQENGADDRKKEKAKEAKLEISGVFLMCSHDHL